MNRSEEIRQQFDRSFQEAPSHRRARAQNQLLLNLGARSLSLPLSQVAEVLRSQKITALPGSPPELLGLIGLRGALVPVYRLADLVGLRAAEEGGGPLWILIVPQPEFVGFALEAQAVSLVDAVSEDAVEVDLIALVEQIRARFGHE